MSLQLITLSEFATLLEETDKVQCFGSLVYGDKCCALGLVALEVGIPINIGTYNSPILRKLQDEFFDLFDISITTTNDVLKKNFKEIAHLIRTKLGDSNDTN